MGGDGNQIDLQEPAQVFGFLQERGYNYMAIAEDAVMPSVDIETDLKKARNFVFFSKSYHLDY